jgi:sodium/bile acid cotransporter 7
LGFVSSKNQTPESKDGYHFKTSESYPLISFPFKPRYNPAFRGNGLIMKDLFIKRWFLLLLVGGVLLAAVMPRNLLPVVAMVQPKLIVPAALFLMAWCLETRSLWSTLLRPWPAIWAVIISYGLIPPLGWLAGSLLAITDFRIGLVITASVPCTLASAVLWTRMAKGNEATALLVTLLTIATSWLTTTGWLIVAAGTDVTIGLGNLMFGLFLVLVLPVGIGQSFQAFPPLARFAIKNRTGLGVTSQILVFCIIFRAAVEVFDKLESGAAPVPIASIGAVAAACLLIHLMGLGFGFWTSRAMRFDRPNQIAVALACSQKSLPVALFLYQTYFQSYPLAVIPMAIYHVGQLIVDTLIAERLAAGHQTKMCMPENAPVLS